MIAKVSYVKSLSRALCYGENEKKGGEVLLSDMVFLDHTPQQKAQFWESISNPYRKKAVHIVLSFSDNDTKELRAMPEDARRIREEKIVRQFMAELARRGNNITDCPYVCYHHGNTDNEHFHLYVLMTTNDRRRLRTKLIGKNATLAAARVSLEWQMEGPVRAMKQERYRMEREKTQTRASAEAGVNSTDSGGKVYEDAEAKLKHIQEKINLRRAIDEAAQRRAGYAATIREVAATSHSREEFIAGLKAHDMEFYVDPKHGYSIRLPKVQGNGNHFSFKRLELSPDIVPYMAEPKPEVVKTDIGEGIRSRTGLHRAGTPQASPKWRQSGNGLRTLLTQQGGSQDENREYEVGSDEDYEEGIERENGMRR